jgi:hypothetical protein
LTEPPFHHPSVVLAIRMSIPEIPDDMLHVDIFVFAQSLQSSPGFCQAGYQVGGLLAGWLLAEGFQFLLEGHFELTDEVFGHVRFFNVLE